MSFQHIYWIFLALAVLPILVLLFRMDHKRRDALLGAFVSRHLRDQLVRNLSYRKRFIKQGFIVLALVLGFISLSQPRLGYSYQQVQGKGIEVVFAVDVSKSMLAEDVRPNRLQRAKLAIMDLAQELKGNRLGLVVFAGTAFVECPLTRDYDAFIKSLEITDTSVISRGGTDIAAAIRASMDTFSKGNNFKRFILITDGEDLGEEGIQEAQRAAQSNVVIYTVGVGTEEGELIPVRGPDGNLDYVRDESGTLVKSRLDSDSLKAIAEATKGAYTPLGPRAEGLRYIYEQGIATLPQQELDSYWEKTPIERFQWPLSAMLCLLLLESLMSERRRRL